MVGEVLEGGLLTPSVPFATIQETEALTEEVALHPHSQYLLYYEGKTFETSIKYIAMQPRALISYRNIDCDGLNAVQTVRVTRGKRKVGLHTVEHHDRVKDIRTTYDAFVDGGKNSPQTMTGTRGFIDGNRGPRPPVHPSKPYFCYPMTPEQRRADWISLLSDQSAAAQKQYDGFDWKNSLIFGDAQAAAINHERAFFSTFIVAVNYKKSGRDKCLGKFYWRFENYGQVPKHDKEFYKKDPQVDYATPVPMRLKQKYHLPNNLEREIIRNDYPDYKFFGED